MEGGIFIMFSLGLRGFEKDGEAASCCCMAVESVKAYTHTIYPFFMYIEVTEDQTAGEGVAGW